MARMLIALRIDVVAAEKTFYRTVVAARMASLVAGRKRIMNIALEPECFPADRVNDRMAVPPQLWILRFKTLDEFKGFGGRVVLEGFAKKSIETLRTTGFS